MAETPTDAPTPPMSLEQAHAAIRAELQAHRAKLVLFDALETALALKQTVANLEKQRVATVAGMEEATKAKQAVELSLSEQTTALDTLRGQVAAAQADLRTLTTTISDTKKAWAAEERTRADTQRAALNELDREILAQQGKLKALKDELAAVAAPYVGAQVQA
jgi:chromosome segregation ATPase